ncbi:hypothetical protein [Maribacter polysaccharolyticus]|uniref:hypothetical protein n=1 Tax=Maribacter polysaccharolyticus TaxID=3020831 RepID=UPI00237F27DF|nr:hypothetical protein [Maribacter polysaccharolyticus]MDE3744037.1 hypothetical protein [Maribacter polysaccharolyticus]
MEKENKTDENPLIGRIRKNPKHTFLVMMLLLGLGALFHIHDGYLSDPEIVRTQDNAHFQKALGNFKKDTVHGFGNDLSNLMELMDAEKELEKLLKAENLDTIKLKQLEDKIKKIEYHGKN